MDILENDELTVNKICDEHMHQGIYLLKLLLKNPDTENSKIKIGYMQGEEGLGSFSFLTMDDKKEYQLITWLKYQNAYFISSWNDEIDFKFTFSTPELLELIPLKIRTAMKNLYTKHNPDREDRYLEYVYV